MDKQLVLSLLVLAGPGVCGAILILVPGNIAWGLVILGQILIWTVITYVHFDTKKFEAEQADLYKFKTPQKP